MAQNSTSSYSSASSSAQFPVKKVIRNVVAPGPPPETTFSCTKCYQRFLFEELSTNYEMQCAKCRNVTTLVKCTYCRAEFKQQDGAGAGSSKSSSSKNGTVNGVASSSTKTICRVCDSNEKKYGQPRSCEYCNTIAAFIGTKCVRCVHAETKYGAPVPCEQCKQRCAFNRANGLGSSSASYARQERVLCYLCKCAHKRALVRIGKNGFQDAKQHKRESGSWSSAISSDNKKARADYVKQFFDSSQNNGSTSFQPTPNPLSSFTSPNSTSNSTNFPSSSNSATTNPQPTSSTSFASSVAAALNSDMMSVSDNIVAVAELKERILSLDKQLKNKNQELLRKDVRITELKSEISKEQRDCREKVQDMQKRHNERVLELQQKLNSLSKQHVSMQKEQKESRKVAK